MKSKKQSKLLHDMIIRAQELGFDIKETQTAYEFTRNGLLVDRFLKFSTDYIVDKSVYDMRIKFLEDHGKKSK